MSTQFVKNITLQIQAIPTFIIPMTVSFVDGAHEQPLGQSEAEIWGIWLKAQIEY